MIKEQFENKMIIKNNSFVKVRDIPAGTEKTEETHEDGTLKSAYWRKLHRKKCNSLEFKRVKNKNFTEGKKVNKEEKSDIEKSEKIKGGKK